MKNSFYFISCFDITILINNVYTWTLNNFTVLSDAETFQWLSSCLHFPVQSAGFLYVQHPLRPWFQLLIAGILLSIFAYLPDAGKPLIDFWFVRVVLRDVPLCLTYKLLLIYFTHFYTYTHTFTCTFTRAAILHTAQCALKTGIAWSNEIFFHDTFLSFFIFYKNFTRSPNCYHLNVIVINYYLKSDKP